MGAFQAMIQVIENLRLKGKTLYTKFIWEGFSQPALYNMLMHSPLWRSGLYIYIQTHFWASFNGCHEPLSGKWSLFLPSLFFCRQGYPHCSAWSSASYKFKTDSGKKTAEDVLLSPEGNLAFKSFISTKLANHITSISGQFATLVKHQYENCLSSHTC